jgi:hypothetical protein
MSVLSPRSRCSPPPFGFIPRNLLRFSLASFFPQPTHFILAGVRGETFLSNVSYYSDETPCCKL